MIPRIGTHNAFFIIMLCPKFSFLCLTVFKLLCSVSQSASVYSSTKTRKQRNIRIWNKQLHENKVGYVGRPRKSEALTESWQLHVNKVRCISRPRKSEALTQLSPPYFTGILRASNPKSRIFAKNTHFFKYLKTYFNVIIFVRITI